MSNPDASVTELKLPITAVPGLYSEEFRAALQSVCVPVETAAAGDIVGVAFDYKVTSDDIQLRPVENFILATGNEDSPFRRSDFLRLPDAQRAEIALSVLTAQGIGMKQTPLWQAVDPIEDVENDTQIEVICTPSFAIASVDNYVDARVYDEELDQDLVNRCFIAMLPRAVESAHEVIEVTPIIEPMLRLVNCILEVEDPESDEGPVPLQAPDLNSLIGTRA